ncbi:hypothetical protein [Salmonella enterica]|uniref:hypothetical protein n=1 Tax=Salmonella enterica TaxID=28901 RepID=UPI0009B09CD4|nr:hypothetical protein [Salmonella enterica]
MKKIAGCMYWLKKLSATTATYQPIGSLNKAIKYMLKRRVELRRFPNNCAMLLVNNIHEHARQKLYVINSATIGTGTSLQLL